ncbi:MAG: rhodanese-related sulfurtransferase [Flavobacteriaceae bacterium]|nr:rhodanese-related sulfurtransferase [Flavobacteriaceae bacterium]MBL6685028.1 rhodanese-related sulfurtransferase [Flavobacteriaceae bacterium]
MQLYNKLNKKERLDLINKAGGKRLTLSFYKYHNIKNPNIFRNYLFVEWNKLNVLGRIYVAHEGINAQLSVHSNKLIEFKKSIDNISFLKGVRLNIAIEHRNDAFLKLKIKIKEKIVADGLETNDYNLSISGRHVDANEFNQLLDDDETITIDMRNHYESEIGHFKGAELPDVDSFRESLPLIKKKYENFKKNKNILMYCTGGIRCEKASAYLIDNGYENVFQLNGGIIEYTRQVNENNIENKFIGKNFVFDNRLSERVSAEIISNCHQCGNKSDKHTNCNNEACHLLFIQCEDCAKKYNGCCSKKCEEVYLLPIDQQKKLRKGKRNSNKIFKKGRFNKSILNKI